VRTPLSSFFNSTTSEPMYLPNRILASSWIIRGYASLLLARSSGRRRLRTAAHPIFHRVMMACERAESHLRTFSRPGSA
jgi:hypothetical protein